MSSNEGYGLIGIAPQISTFELVFWWILSLICFVLSVYCMWSSVGEVSARCKKTMEADDLSKKRKKANAEREKESSEMKKADKKKKDDDE